MSDRDDAVYAPASAPVPPVAIVAKGGVDGLVISAAASCAPRGIRVNVVAPAWFARG